MKLYCDKTRARYAAKRELAKGNLNAEPKEGVDFEIVEQEGRFAWVVSLSVQGYSDEAAHAPAAEPAAEQTLAAETAPEWPTSFVPDAENGEIASREYGMLLTRERAVEAAQAAGATDAVITQTARGMFVWRTSQLDKVWKENNVPKAHKASDGPRRERKMSPKHELALTLIKRPEGATAAQVAEATGWQEHSARARITADLRDAFGFGVVKEKTPNGAVYRVAS